jgi:TatD DNase family protein
MLSSSYLDSHAHLPIDDADADKIPPSLGATLINAARQEDWQRIITLSQKQPQVTPFFGIHPWYLTDKQQNWLLELENILHKIKNAGVGEIGLDKPCGIDLTIQQDAFINQLQLAHRLRRPAVVHCVKRWGVLLNILSTLHKNNQLPHLMLHAYNGSLATMQQLVSWGCFISFSPALLKRLKQQELLQATPSQHILLETDEPLAADNSLKIIKKLYALAARLKNTEIDNFRYRIWNNGQIFTHTPHAGKG